MTELITRPGAWLLQQAATLPDTVVMKTVAVPRGWFETVASVARDITAVAMVALVVAVAAVAWTLWRNVRKVRDLLDKVYADLAPVTRAASSIADNLNYVTTSIRRDVEEVNATIASANRQLHHAVEVAERRVNEFSALLQVVQQEAEQAFVGTASVVRGVRAGAARLGGINDEAEDLLGEGEDDGDDDESETEAAGEPQRGNGRDTKASSRDGTARPRVRSHRARGG